MKIVKNKYDIHGKIESWLSHAKRISRNSDHPTFQHGAVLVKGGSVVSSSANYSRYLSFADKFRGYDEWHGTYHAEVGCVYNLSKDKTENATLYVARVNNQGEFKNSKPCDMCIKALKHMGVQKVVYTINDEKVKEMYL